MNTGVNQMRKIFIRILRKQTFHNTLFSKVAARLMYVSEAAERKESIKSVLDMLGENTTGDYWKEKKNRIMDILFARAFYSITYEEYYLYGLDQSHSKDKMAYVGWLELDQYYRKLNKKGKPELFESKEKTYEEFKKYFNREVLFISKENQRDLFILFVKKHSTCMLKPVDSYGGHGIELISISEKCPPEMCWERVKPSIPFILEELITQAPEMSEYYSYAVNTIRYNTFYNEGELTKLQAVFRIGRGGSFVDNASSGGIYVLVDAEKGRILGPARSFQNELFEKHPDTGMKFEGNYIPRWDELNALLDQVVRIVPEQKQVGWDFALSTNGWVMVEANTTPVLQDFDLDHGLRELLKKTFGKCIYIWR